jgi:glycosyltransferase involved in cell wall biosynthesis
MPCLNEAKTISACINKAKAYLGRSVVNGEVLIADNGSTDGSQQITRSVGARVVNVNRHDYALPGSIAKARGTFVIIGDADDSYDFSALENSLKQLRAGDDLVVGDRFRGGIAPSTMPFLHLYLGNPVLSLVGRLSFRVPLQDFHCGLRGFRTQAMRDLGRRTTGMEFASEMIVRAGLMGLRISELPTMLKPDGRSRRPHSPKWLFVVPGTIFLAAAIVRASTLSTGTLWIPGGAGLDLNSFIVACFLTILGTEAIGFGLIARRYAAVMGPARQKLVVSGPRVCRAANSNMTQIVARVLHV